MSWTRAARTEKRKRPPSRCAGGLALVHGPASQRGAAWTTATASAAPGLQRRTAESLGAQRSVSCPRPMCAGHGRRPHKAKQGGTDRTVVRVQLDEAGTLLQHLRADRYLRAPGHFWLSAGAALSGGKKAVAEKEKCSAKGPRGAPG